MESQYKALAAAIATLAVQDLESLHKKVKKWEKAERDGRLKEYVRDVIHSQEGKKAKCYERINITQDEVSAVVFFVDLASIGGITFEILSLELENLPQKIKDQLAFIKENGARLLKRVSTFTRQITKEENDMAI